MRQVNYIIVFTLCIMEQKQSKKALASAYKTEASDYTFRLFRSIYLI